MKKPAHHLIAEVPRKRSKAELTIDCGYKRTIELTSLSISYTAAKGKSPLYGAGFHPSQRL